ncbi:MAG: hypothetical protein WC303_01000 [Candidatus Paceibacterota bacterium]|jgi:hypothetical protein
MITLESNYLISHNKEICKSILVEINKNKENSDYHKMKIKEDLSVFFISLHLVLEIGLNAFFRKIHLKQIKKELDPIKVAENLDGISFIDKTILFIYNSKFNFDDIQKATDYHKIIRKIKNFNEIRNKLMHGHSIGFDIGNLEDGKLPESFEDSKLFKLLTIKNCENQIELFLEIMEGMSYYFESLESDYSKDDIKKFKDLYLSGDFILEEYKKL